MLLQVGGLSLGAVAVPLPKPPGYEEKGMQRPARDEKRIEGSATALRGLAILLVKSKSGQR